MISSEIGEGALYDTPFPHFMSHHALVEVAAAALLDWFQNAAPWKLVEAEFYEQYEINLRTVDVSVRIEPLRNLEKPRIILLQNL